MPDPMTLSQCVAELKELFTTLTEADELAESIRSQKGEIDRLRALVHDQSTEVGLLRGEKATQARTIQTQQGEITMLRDERIKHIEDHASERQRWATDRKAQQDRIASLNASLNNAMRTNREHQVTISGLKGSINIYEEMIANATAVQAEKPKKKLRKALKQIDEWENYADELNERINELQRQLGICDKAGVDISDIIEQTRRNIL
jgi:chromosome segregation ATPase